MTGKTAESTSSERTSIRVLHAAKLFPPPFGGIETVLERLTQGLCELDPLLHLDILATHPTTSSSTERYDGRLKVSEIRSIFQIARTPIAPGYLKALNQSSADLVHFHFPYPWAELSFLFSSLKKPYIISYHSDIVKQKTLLKIWKPFMNRFLSGAARIVVASPHIIRSSPVLNGSLSKKTEVIPYGIDTAYFQSTNNTIEEALGLRVEVAGAKPLLFFLGRLVYYKGINILIEAMKNLDAHLIIGGDGPLRNELENLVRRSGLTSKVTFAGNIPTEELRKYYQAADLFVLPSTDTSEAFGMVMLEAHASGIPVISTDLPTGVVFVNQHNKTGLCVRAQDSIALAVGFQMLLNNPILRSEMGAFAKKRAGEEFDTRIMSKRYYELYKKVLA